MLILSRRIGEKIVVAGNIFIEIVDVRGSSVQIGVSADKSVSVHRKEVQDEIDREKGKNAKSQ